MCISLYLQCIICVSSYMYQMCILFVSSIYPCKSMREINVKSMLDIYVAVKILNSISTNFDSKSVQHLQSSSKFIYCRIYVFSNEYQAYPLKKLFSQVFLMLYFDSKPVQVIFNLSQILYIALFMYFRRTITIPIKFFFYQLGYLNVVYHW